jgi:septum formation inhibitor MinC
LDILTAEAPEIVESLIQQEIYLWNIIAMQNREIAEYVRQIQQLNQQLLMSVQNQQNQQLHEGGPSPMQQQRPQERQNPQQQQPFPMAPNGESHGCMVAWLHGHII